MRYGDEALGQQWSALDTSLYGRGDAPWSAPALIDALSAARRRWKRARRTRHRATMLPPLNPA